MNLKKYFSKNYLPIDDFFSKVLYDKKVGYYSKKFPIGRQGDYITSPEITSLFSEIITLWSILFWENLGKPKKLNIVELGPGSGNLSKVFLNTSKKFPSFYRSLNFNLFEKNKKLKILQSRNLKGEKVKWINNFSKINKYPTLFIGNEFLDSIPVKQYKRSKNEIFERFLSFDLNGNFKFEYKKVKSIEKKYLNKFLSIKKLHEFEFPVMGFKILDKIIHVIKKNNGGILLFDYGFIGNKSGFTVQSLKNHKRNDPFKNIGSSDITSLVNFNLLKEYSEINKLYVQNIVTQSKFLKEMGIIERANSASKNISFSEKTKLYLSLKRLLDPNLMGNLFKVFLATNKVKNCIGFS